MDLSGEGLQVQNTGVVSMQDYLRQKEELRRLKGIIEAAERSMDLQLAGQMQPIVAAVPQQAVAPGPYVYPPGSLPALSLSVPRPSSPMAQETARIVEIDSHPSSPNQTSTVSTYKVTDNTESYQGYTQPGRTHPTSMGPSNMFSQPGPLNAYNYQQPPSMNYTHERSVRLSSSQYNQPLIDSHSQVALPQRNQAPIHSNHTGSIRPNSRGHQESLYPLQNGSSTAKRYGALDQLFSESVKQMPVSNLQRTLPNGEAPVGNLSPFVPRSHMQNSNMHCLRRPMQNRDYVPPHSNFGYAPPHVNFGSLGPRVPRDSQGASNTPEQSTSTNVSISGRKTPIPISYIMSGTGTTQVLDGTHQESVPLRHQGIPGPMDGVEVLSAPAQSPSRLNDPASIQSTSSSSFSSYVEPANPGALSSTVPAGQIHTNVMEKSQLPALSMLTEILASHEQWREEASSRIIKQAMGSHNPPKNVGEDESIGIQASIPLNAVASSSERPETQQNSQTAVFSSDMQGPHSPTLHVHAPPSTAENGDVIEKADVGTAKPIPEKSEVNTLPFLREPVLRASLMSHNDGVSCVSAAGPSSRTPVRGDKPGHSTSSPIGADRKTLAKDILRALLPPSTKRKRDSVDTCEGTGLSTDHPADSPAKKNKTSIPDVSRELDRSLTNGYVPTHESQEVGRPSTTTSFRAPLSQPYFIPEPSQATVSQPATSHQFLFLSPQQQPVPPLAGPSRMPVRPPGEPVPPPAGPSRMMAQGPVPVHPPPGQPWAPGSWTMGSSSQYSPYYQQYRIWPPTSWPSNSVTHPSTSQMGPPPLQRTKDSLGPSNKKSRAKPPLAKEQLMTRQPLFLPSSESPPASPNLKPSETNRVLQEGRGIPLPKLKPVVEISSPRAISKIAAFSPALLDANTSGEMFGKPTGVLAAASAAIPHVGALPSRSRPYVLVPQVDKGLWLVSGQTRSSKGKASDSLPIQSGADTIPDDDDEENEDRARDFARRLVRRPCLWKDCQAMLDSGEKLTKHVKVVHGKENENMLYVCRWKECQSTRAFPDSEKLIRHLQWHVSSRIYCGYRGCSFQTQLAVQLKVHVSEYHSDRDRLRPLAVPFSQLVPQGLPKLVDDTLPTYMSVPIPVSPREISRDRHQKIGPWVLRHIFGKVAINKGAVSAAVPLRSQRLLEKQEFSVPRDESYQQVQRKFNPQDEYEFLKRAGVTKSFAPLALLPLTIDDLEVTEETELDLVNAEPSKPETSVSDVVEDSLIQDPASFEGVTDLDPADAEAPKPHTSADFVEDSVIQDPARSEEGTDLDPADAEPSKLQTSVDVVGDSVIQDPARFEGATQGGSEQLGLIAAMDVGNVQTVPSGVVLGPAHEADEVEGLL